MAWAKPKALRRGDRVAVVSPAGPLPEARYPDLERGLDLLRSWGLKPEVFPHAKARRGYLAGTDAERLGDLQRAMDSEVHSAVFCVRGGYGCTRLLADLDLRTIAKRPKLVVGYSDVTAILSALVGVGVMGIHGPMIATSKGMAMGPAATELQRRLLFDPEPPGRLRFSGGGDSPSPHALVPGAAQGPLVGGNLSLVASLAGTPWQLSSRDRLLFLEDIDEKPYRVDRMLTQLMQCGTLDGVRGVLLGDFSFGKNGSAESLAAVLPVFEDRLGSLGVPVAYGFPFGHCAASWSLPTGALARLEATRREKAAVLRLLESPVAPAD